ncbi:TPA: LysR family transcriptional regulator [Clostridioides difficile]|nr:LysR family transcriptional regulator [Clostridioides difficile]HBH3647358.1 LysR family transcriptional regulator [Clostridioides difficile]
MNLYHLRYFVTLAHLEHYTKAAENLSITQPSLSHAISLLENELGVALFEKEGRNIVLTKYGKIFLKDVEKSLEILDSSIKSLKITGTGEGQIDLAFLRTLGTDFIPDIVHKFLKSNPAKSIDFKFHTGVTTDIIQGLKERKYDIAFCSKLEKEKGIEFIPVAKQDLVLIVPYSHPLAAKNTIDLKETIPYPQIVFNQRSGLRYIIDDMFKKINQQPNIVYEVEEDQVIAGLVAKNFGIAVVPNMNMLSFTKVKVIQIIHPSWERNFYLAFIKDRYLPPAIKNFKNFVIKNAQL